MQPFDKKRFALFWQLGFTPRASSKSRKTSTPLSRISLGFVWAVKLAHVEYICEDRANNTHASNAHHSSKMVVSLYPRSIGAYLRNMVLCHDIYNGVPSLGLDIYGDVHNHPNPKILDGRYLHSEKFHFLLLTGNTHDPVMTPANMGVYDLTPLRMSCRDITAAHRHQIMSLVT